MDNRWEKVKFQFVKFRDTVIIKGYEQIMDMLDEDILKTQRLQFSPHKKQFENRILTKNKSLKLIGDVLEEWSKL